MSLQTSNNLHHSPFKAVSISHYNRKLCQLKNHLQNLSINLLLGKLRLNRFRLNLKICGPRLYKGCPWWNLRYIRMKICKKSDWKSLDSTRSKGLRALLTRLNTLKLQILSLNKYYLEGQKYMFRLHSQTSILNSVISFLKCWRALNLTGLLWIK